MRSPARQELRAILFAAAAFVAACKPSGSTDHAADVAALRAVEIAEEQATIDKNVEKLLSFYADDAVIQNANEPALVGKTQIRASLITGFADTSSSDKFVLTAVDVAQSGELGYTVGTNDYTHVDPHTGKATTDHGKWLTVRKKLADGAWKIVYDTYSSDAPRAAP